MLKRKIDERLLTWMNQRNALLVYGARQVGKTTSIRSFCNDHFNHAYSINFSDDIRSLNLLLNVQSLSEFNDMLAYIFGEKPVKGDVIFFDEIQVYYEQRENAELVNPGFKNRTVDILTLAKSVVEQGAYRLILSGSLLGVSVFGVNLNPTGYVDEITMYPMDFEEFLWALNTPSFVIDKAKACFEKCEPMERALNDELLKKFKEYVIVGGMPSAVDAYINGNDEKYVSYAHQSVLSWYRKDIIKYAPSESKLIISNMFDILPSEVAEKNKKFVKSHMDVPNFKNLDLRDRFLWLENAGIAIPIYNVDNVESPLKISVNYKTVKLFSNDVGLLVEQLFEGAGLRLIKEGDDYNLGAIYENAVAELLISHGLKPYFHSNKKGGEIDFLIEKDLSPIAIEIKSGVGDEHHIYEHKALDHVLEAKKGKIKAMVFGNTNVFKEREDIQNYPLYMIEFVRRK